MYQVPYIINGVLVHVKDVTAHFQYEKEQGAIILSSLESVVRVCIIGRKTWKDNGGCFCSLNCGHYRCWQTVFVK